MSTYKSEARNYKNVSKDIKIAFVTGEFNREYTKELEDVNEEFLIKHGFDYVDKYLVPGAFEIPGFTRKLLDAEEYDLIITFWVVIRWSTPHFDYVCTETARAIMDLTVGYDTPIIFWVLTCNTEEQVKERISTNYAISGLNLLSELEW